MSGTKITSWPGEGMYPPQTRVLPSGTLLPRPSCSQSLGPIPTLETWPSIGQSWRCSTYVGVLALQARPPIAGGCAALCRAQLTAPTATIWRMPSCAGAWVLSPDRRQHVSSPCRSQGDGALPLACAPTAASPSLGIRASSQSREGNVNMRDRLYHPSPSAFTSQSRR